MPANPQSLPPRTLVSFGLLLVAVLAAVGIWSWWQTRLAWPWAAAALVAAAVTWQRPAWLAPAARGWLKLAEWLHALVNPVVMLALFLLAFIPTALVMRLAGKDPLRLKRDPKALSYWIRRDDSRRPASSMRDQF